MNLMISSLRIDSIILHEIQVRLTGLSFIGFFLSPFLNIADTIELFHSFGNSPSWRDELKIIDIGVHNSSFSSFRILGCILSGPGDLFTLRLFSFFLTISGVMMQLSYSANLGSQCTTSATHNLKVVGGS